jgi:diguanylate cyclase (GGDEF)-like protein
MTSMPDVMESLKRNAITFGLRVIVIGGIIATLLHLIQGKAHPISLVLPPLTSIVSLGLLLYLHQYPQRIYQVIKLTFAWLSFIILLPEYFFVFETVFNPEKRLIDTLPPITSGIFLLSMGMIVFLRPRALVRKVFVLWAITAAPVVIYLIFHPQELQTPRGMDLLITLVPAMGINLTLILFYSQLQDTVDKLHIERLRLKEISETDALTQVLNRAAGERMLQSLIDQATQKIGIILCDIDHFKRINDNYGHLSGDRVLQTMAKSCQANLRQQDTLIRLGGEEFLIVVSGDEEAELVQLAERLRYIIANLQIPDVGKITASFGVAFLQPAEDLTTVFARADQALYRAKALGRNQVVYA